MSDEKQAYVANTELNPVGFDEFFADLLYAAGYVEDTEIENLGAEDAATISGIYKNAISVLGEEKRRLTALVAMCDAAQGHFRGAGDGQEN